MYAKTIERSVSHFIFIFSTALPSFTKFYFNLLPYSTSTAGMQSAFNIRTDRKQFSLATEEGLREM